VPAVIVTMQAGGQNVLLPLQTSSQHYLPIATWWPEYIVTIANGVASTYCTYCRSDGIHYEGDPKLGYGVNVMVYIFIWVIF